MNSLMKPREFVRRYMEPVVHMRPGQVDEHIVQSVNGIAELLREGREDEVIRSYDGQAPSLPEDKRYCTALIGAYLQQGKNIERAGELADAAIAYHLDQGEQQSAATAMAQRGRVAYRLEGLNGALRYYRRAIELDQRCNTAWANAFCHTSVEERLDILETLVADFVNCYPDFADDLNLRRFFAEDAQLAWAARQPVFANAILSTLKTN